MKVESVTILLIEDNDDHAELVKRSFEEHKLSNYLIRLSDGESAMNYLFRKGDYSNEDKYPTPDLILLDLRLPKIDGIEILHKIKKSDTLRKIPVVILTSSEAESDIAKAYVNYVNSYIVKPLDFNKFTDLLNTMGIYWLGWNKKPS